MNKFMLLSLCVFTLLLQNSCLHIQSKKSLFETRIDSIQQFLSRDAVKVYDFYEISKKGWDWYKDSHLIQIDSLFYTKYINNPTILNPNYNWYYQTNYFYRLIDMHDGLINIIILKRIHNDNEAYMYFLQFDKNGNRIQYFLLASIIKGPDDYEKVYSIIKEGKIISYKYYCEENDGIKQETRDTIEYELKNGLNPPLK